MPNSEQKVKECDATAAASSHPVGLQQMIKAEGLIMEINLTTETYFAKKLQGTNYFVLFKKRVFNKPPTIHYQQSVSLF